MIGRARFRRARHSSLQRFPILRLIKLNNKFEIFLQ